jgi:iron complex transport system ATP-binding protein
MRAAATTGLGYQIGGSVLLHDVDFDLAAGELVGVIGPNGAGKTTLLQLLAGELDPTSGVIEIAGQEIGEGTLGELALRRSVLPQHHLLQFAFRCLDVVLMGRYPHGGSESESQAVAERTMVETDTIHLADRLFTTLSGGEQTRVSFARVLAQETPLLLLDEPTGSLDLRHQEVVMNTLRGLAGAGVAIVAVLHDVNLAARFADRIMILNDGSVEAIGTPNEVLTPEVLRSVYGLDVTVIRHPVEDCPLILPSRGETGV